jgi:uncharacterized membrane protein HdeD (DUF308 family)
MQGNDASGLEKRWTMSSDRARRFRGVLFLLLGCLAILTPFFAGSLALFLVGTLLVAFGALEMLETFQPADEVSKRSTYLSGALSIFAGILLLAQPQLVVTGLRWFLAASFFIDGTGKIIAAIKSRRTGNPWRWILAGGLVSVLIAAALAARWPVPGQTAVAFLIGIRMCSAGTSMLLSRREVPERAVGAPGDGTHPDARLHLPPHQEFSKLRRSLTTEESARRRIDAVWCWTFILVFFAIHIGRMNVDWNLVGMVSPLVAVLGNVGTALLVAFCIILPVQLAWRAMSRPLERAAWRRLLSKADAGRGPGLSGRLYGGWLVRRLRFSLRAARMRYSPRAALRWGLQVGLPVTAILIAVNPIWGFSWFFNSESWATEIWDRWAAARTDLARTDDSGGGRSLRYRP